MIITVKLSGKTTNCLKILLESNWKKMYLVYFTINLACSFALETCLKITKVWSWLEKTKTSWIVGKLLSYAWGSTQKGYFQMIKVWWVPFVLLLITFEGGKNKHVMKYDVVMWAILANFNIGRCGKYHNILCTVVWVVRHVNLTFAFFLFFSKRITTNIPSNGT